MGLTNWTLNRANTTSGRSSITVRGTDPVTLDREIAKAERKGYVRIGNPYTAREYNQTIFYQSMTLGVQQVATASGETVTTPVEVKKSFPWGWLIFGLLLVVAFPWLLIIIIPILGFVFYQGAKGRKNGSPKSTAKNQVNDEIGSNHKKEKTHSSNKSSKKSTTKPKAK